MAGKKNTSSGAKKVTVDVNTAKAKSDAVENQECKPYTIIREPYLDGDGQFKIKETRIE
jgi:hypothetical protein